MNADKLYHMKCRAIAYAPAVPPRVRFGSEADKRHRATRLVSFSDFGKPER